MFQFCFIRAWAEQNGYDLCLLPWVGEKVFNIPEAVRPDKHKPDLVWPECMYQNQASLIYTRKQVKEWFTFKPEVLERLACIKHFAPVLLNVRQAQDYRSAGLVTLSRECYVDACRRFEYDPNQASWELDTNPTRLPDFDGDLSASGHCTTWAGIPSFYRLMTAPVLFRANSTFSWWAATLSDGRVYSPVIRGLRGGVPDQHCPKFVEGNWPVMADNFPNTDLYLMDGYILPRRP